jgi:hypothetical protein
VPFGMKASICLRCGHVKLIKVTDEHKDCTLCGDKITPTLTGSRGSGWPAPAREQKT